MAAGSWTLALLLLPACSSAPPLAETRSSAQAVALDVLDALERRDRARLAALALGEREFRDHVWPRLPAARPERNLPFSYVWGDLRQKSETTLSLTLARHGGRRYELSDLTFADERDYGTYRVHRNATLHVRDAGGDPADLRVLGSMIEQGGEWKVFSYIVDD